MSQYHGIEATIDEIERMKENVKTTKNFKSKAMAKESLYSYTLAMIANGQMNCAAKSSLANRALEVETYDD